MTADPILFLFAAQVVLFGGFLIGLCRLNRRRR